MGRTVTLILVDPAGSMLGQLPPYAVPTPWRQEAAEVVDGARQHYGIDVTVLRMLAASAGQYGGEVSYLAECANLDGAPVAPVQVTLGPDPRRPRYAELGGPAASLAWAESILGDVRARQLRTWNLSSIWRLEHAGGTAWLKEVPAFFHHEATVLSWLNHTVPARTPLLIAADGGRMLLADIAGEDGYSASPQQRATMLHDLHDIQRPAIAAVPSLTELGIPDRRSGILADKIRQTVQRHGDPALLAGLDDRLAAIDACGLPDTLVHGDFHPGNVRGTVILDWGDSFLGNPGFDLHRMIERVPDPEPLIAAWCARWQATAPAADPRRALSLLEPICALRNATIYADFLDQIEPTEHPYHAADVPFWLAQATLPQTPHP